MENPSCQSWTILKAKIDILVFLIFLILFKESHFCLFFICKVSLGYVKGTLSQIYLFILVMNPYCVYCILTPVPCPQVVIVTTTPSAVDLTRRCTRPAGRGVEVCVRTVCTTPRGQSVTSVPRATSQTLTAKWTVLTPAYVS